MEKEVLAEISQIIPSDRIFNDLSERYCYSYDASFGEYLPEIVIQPKNATEISKLVKLANIHIKAEEVDCSIHLTLVVPMWPQPSLLILAVRCK
ncbi:hypothetical protein [Peribacillus sp. R9-11]|uniref:hypothetical protein n=1 Tax=Peribacillus sp. R9-11 TaxID=3073271 RepID=UPI0028685458|nr:hypothetical protein [Peribacillus sp. R9-11]WMX58197.1 hypothetical protein RE409_13815 [Peribacillus sp. R9-11]